MPKSITAPGKAENSLCASPYRSDPCHVAPATPGQPFFPPRQYPFSLMRGQLFSSLSILDVDPHTRAHSGTTVQTTSDKELLSLIQSGDRGAFTELYKRYRRALYAFCARLLGDTQAAEDAVHETFMKLSTESSSIAQPAALKSWLFTVARNEALMTIRGRRDGARGDAESVWDDETPQSLAEKADVGRFVQGALSRLKVEYREVILLREFEGLSYAEIASVTGDSASSVKSRLFKARRALAGKLEGVWNEERDDK